jgi:hypothetical protein
MVTEHASTFFVFSLAVMCLNVQKHAPSLKVMMFKLMFLSMFVIVIVRDASFTHVVEN